MQLAKKAEEKKKASQGDKPCQTLNVFNCRDFLSNWHMNKQIHMGTKSAEGFSPQGKTIHPPYPPVLKQPGSSLKRKFRIDTDLQMLA